MLKKKILIVEDESITALNIKAILNSKEFEVPGIASSAEEAVNLTEKHSPDLILMDIILNGEKDGITAVSEIKEKYDIPIIYCTSHSDEMTLNRAKETEPHGYIIKPINRNELLSTVEITLYKHEMERKLKASEKKYHSLLNAMPDLMFILSGSGEHLFHHSPSINELFIAPEIFTGRCVNDVLPSDVAESYLKNIKNTLETGKMQIFEYQLNFEDTGLQYYESRMVKYKENEVLVIVRNITGRIMNEEKLQAQNRELTELKEQMEFKEESYRLLVENAGDGFELLDEDGRYIDMNSASCQALGYTREELLLLSIPDIDPQVNIDKFHEISNGMTDGAPLSFESVHRRKDGSLFPVEITSTKFQTGEETRFLSLVRDITIRKKTEKAHRNSEKMMYLLADKMAGYVAYVGIDDLRYRFVNKKFEETFRLPREDITGKHIKEVIGEANYEFALKFIEKVKAGIETSYENEFNTEIGKIWVKVNYVPDFDEQGKVIGIVVLSYDITESKKAEEHIKASLKEKEILLSEIHHRVKNNMQVVTSLLNLQTNRSKDEETRRYLIDTESRVRSMALVHEKLYRSKDLSRIDFREYVTDLLRDLTKAISISSNKIVIETSIDESSVDVSKAIPLGLLITEIVSNSFKHAFPGNKRGNIRVEFNRDNEGIYSLAIHDNGTGLPADFETRKNDSLGLQLVSALTQQLKGKLEVTGEKGTRVTVTFP